MLTTLKTLRTIIQENQLALSFEEIALAYRAGRDPSLLALAFCKAYKLILVTAKMYLGLTSEDVASYSLEKLDFCLQTFNPNHATRFTTYFTKVLKNKLREETQSLSTQKRKAILFATSYEVLLAAGYEKAADPISDSIDDALLGYDLNDKEIRYCRLISQNYTNAEIAKLFGVSRMYISNLRKKLKKKLTPMTLRYT